MFSFTSFLTLILFHKHLSVIHLLTSHLLPRYSCSSYIYSHTLSCSLYENDDDMKKNGNNNKIKENPDENLRLRCKGKLNGNGDAMRGSVDLLSCSLKCERDLGWNFGAHVRDFQVMCVVWSLKEKVLCRWGWWDLVWSGFGYPTRCSCLINMEMLLKN